MIPHNHRTPLKEISDTLSIALKLGNTKDADILRDFVAYHKRKGQLTDGQERFFKTLSSRNTASQVKDSTEWAKKFDSPRYCAEVKVVCDYYKHQPYYGSRHTATRVLEFLDPSHPETTLPQYSEFLRMFDNKYARKLRESIAADPLWSVGDLVQVRKGSVYETGKRHLKNGLWAGMRITEASAHYSGPAYNASIPAAWDVPMAIIQITGKFGRPLAYEAKRGGVRYYKLLPLGFVEPIEVMERDLKKAQKKKIS